MIVYLAGPMRGYPEFNSPALHEAAARIRADGHEVFNPAEHDHQDSIRDALSIDLAWICAHADTICLLPGWEKSMSATAERAVGIALGLQIVEL